MDDLLVERFWARVRKEEKDRGEHWIWTGSKAPRNYPKIFYKGVEYQAMRLSYCIAHNLEISEIEHLTMRKLCDKRLCVNPSHMAAALRAD